MTPKEKLEERLRKTLAKLLRRNNLKRRATLLMRCTEIKKQLNQLIEDGLK